MDIKEHKNNDLIVSNKLQEYVDNFIHTDVLQWIIFRRQKDLFSSPARPLLQSAN
jgi:hypothetical protein